MAQQIRITAGLELTGDLDSFTIQPRQQVIAQQTAAPNRVGGTQSIGHAAHEALDLGDLTTVGIAHFRNRDATNWVEIGIEEDAAFFPFIRLLPGESCIVRISPTCTPYAKANVAAVILQRDILDN